MIRKELVFVIPCIGGQEYLAETVLDVDAYIKRSHHIIFVDDSKDNRLKDFQGADYTTIWSGGKCGFGNYLGWTMPLPCHGLIRTTAIGLNHALDHFDFDFAVYFDDDSTVVNPGFDDWIYERHESTGFDLLGAQDCIYVEPRLYMFEELETHFAKYNLLGKKVHEFQEGMFYAIHVQSRRFVEKQKAVGLLDDDELWRKTQVWIDPYTSFVCEMLGLKYVAAGAMYDLGGKMAPPLLTTWRRAMDLDIKPLLERGEYLAMHRTKNMMWSGELLAEPELRAKLRDRRNLYLERKNMKVSVILTCWRRHHNLERIIPVFLSEPEVDEIIVWDNSGTFKTELPVTVISSNKNFGANVRFALASIAKNDAVLFCDDDILPKAGILADLLQHYNNNTCLGIYGRNFAGSYKEGEHVYAEKISEPREVQHIVGYLLLMPRWALLDQCYAKYPWYCGEVELFGRMKWVKKIIPPTDKFENLLEMQDEHALCLNPDAPAEYEAVWQRWFN